MVHVIIARGSRRQLSYVSYTKYLCEIKSLYKLFKIYRDIYHLRINKNDLYRK
jgi:hypothetical protein